MVTIEPLPTLRKYREAELDPETATVKIALFDDSQNYSPDRVNHEFVGDVIGAPGDATGPAATELSDASYARQTVSNVQVTEDTTDVEVVLDADDVTFSSLAGGETIQGWLMYIQVGADDTTPNDDPIIALEDEATNSSNNPITTSGVDITVQFDSEGIINQSPA